MVGGGSPLVALMAPETMTVKILCNNDTYTGRILDMDKQGYIEFEADFEHGETSTIILCSASVERIDLA